MKMKVKKEGKEKQENREIGIIKFEKGGFANYRNIYHLAKVIEKILPEPSQKEKREMLYEDLGWCPHGCADDEDCEECH